MLTIAAMVVNGGARHSTAMYSSNRERNGFLWLQGDDTMLPTMQELPPRVAHGKRTKKQQ